MALSLASKLELASDALAGFAARFLGKPVSGASQLAGNVALIRAANTINSFKLIVLYFVEPLIIL